VPFAQVSGRKWRIPNKLGKNEVVSGGFVDFEDFENIFKPYGIFNGAVWSEDSQRTCFIENGHALLQEILGMTTYTFKKSTNGSHVHIEYLKIDLTKTHQNVSSALHIPTIDPSHPKTLLTASNGNFC